MYFIYFLGFSYYVSRSAKQCTTPANLCFLLQNHSCQFQRFLISSLCTNSFHEPSHCTLGARPTIMHREPIGLIDSKRRHGAINQWVCYGGYLIVARHCSMGLLVGYFHVRRKNGSSKTSSGNKICSNTFQNGSDVIRYPISDRYFKPCIQNTK